MARIHRIGGLIALAVLILLQAGEAFAADELESAPCAGPDPNCTDQILNIRPPRFPWYVRVEGITLTRDVEGEIAFATRGTPTNVVLATDDFDFPFNAGARVLLGHTLNECYQLEGSFFDVAQWKDEATVRDTTGTMRGPFFGGVAATALNNINFAAIDGTSYLQNAEINLRRHVGMPPGRADVSFLFGLRYVRVAEGFDYFSTTVTGVSSNLGVTARNDMIGPQIGMLVEFFKEQCWWINFEMKGAILHNSATQDTVFATGAGAFPGHAAENDTAFLGDLSLDGVYRFSPRFSARFGYQIIWIGGLALATENANPDVNILTSGPARVVNDGEVVYHGPHAGLEFAW